MSENIFTVSHKHRKHFSVMVNYCVSDMGSIFSNIRLRLSVETATDNQMLKECTFFLQYTRMFQVMVQRHNRHKPMSLYLAVIAVVDTIVLSIGQSMCEI